MAVESTEINISYAGDGSSTTFSYPYYFREPSDLVVTLVDSSENVTSQTYNSDYSVTATAVNGVYPNGGSVVFNTPPSDTETVLITRRTPQQQATVYQSNDNFPAKTTETALDLLQLQFQEIARHYKGYADGIPTEGTFVADDWFYVRNAGTFGFKEIICTVGGTPGTWKPINPIGA